nr:hypothetical protein [Rhodococcus sp. (in: high G+C Gram-positive bacteria)]
MNLNDRMEFDHVIEVHEDGSITDRRDLHAPDVYWSDGDATCMYEGWSLLQGFTGQYGYNGPCMHPSEFIGGGMERHILETPGVYVAVTVSDLDIDSDEEDDLVGWAVAIRDNILSEWPVKP